MHHHRHWEIVVGSNQKMLHTNGGATVVWVDFDQQKAVDLPDWMRKMVTG